jgi:hypothetical protein
MAARTIFTNKTIFASLLAIGIAGTAQAQAPSPLNIAGRAPAQAVGNIVGGGNGAAIFGGGDDMTIQYSLPGAGGGGAGWGTAGLVGRFVNTQGDGLQVEYGAPTEPARAGREAWLTGGGDDAQVVYTAPYQRR